MMALAAFLCEPRLFFSKNKKKPFCARKKEKLKLQKKFVCVEV
jgi:hypothetical protein